MNHSLELLRPQEFTVLNRQEVKETREKAHELAHGEKTPFLLTIMGMLNAYTWRAAVDQSAITQNPDGQWIISYPATIKNDDGTYTVEPGKYNHLLNISAKGELEITVAVKFTSEYLEKHWPMSYHSQDKVKEARKLLLELGLFYYDIDSRPKGAKWGKKNGIPAQGVATPPILEKVDIARMLIFYQVLDGIVRSRTEAISDGSSYNFMPDHGGALMVDLYDALFEGICNFRGAVFADVVEANAVEVETNPVIKTIKWFYRRCENKMKELSRGVWAGMVRRAGEIPAPKLIARTEDPFFSPFGDLAEIPY